MSDVTSEVSPSSCTVCFTKVAHVKRYCADTGEYLHMVCLRCSSTTFADGRFKKGVCR